jgi:uncharacterized membrane protein
MSQGTPSTTEGKQGESVEDLIGGRVFAWVGGLAVLVGLAFLFAIGISSGWIGEGARTLLGAVVSGGLLGGGIWLHSRKGRTDAAVAGLASGIAGLFVTVTVAAQVYELIPTLMGTAIALAVGALATALAVRWESRGIAALGILGALCSPLLAGSDVDGGSVVILFVALAAAVGVLMWQRWNWLAIAALVVSAPQWIVYLFDGASPTSAIVTLIAFGGLGTVLAVGHDIRIHESGVRTLSSFLLALNSVVIAGAGWFALAAMDATATGKVWLVALAVTYAVLGVVAPRLPGVSLELGILSLTLSVVVADVAFALIADGPVLAVGWAITGIGFAALLRHVRNQGGADDLVGVGLGSHLMAAIVVAATVDDPMAILAGDAQLSAAGAAAFAAIAAGCLVSARLASERDLAWRVVRVAAGLASVARLMALALDGPVLTLTWVAEAVALGVIAVRHGDRIAGWGSVGFLALAVIHVLMADAPFETLDGPVELMANLIPVAAVSAAALVGSRVISALLIPDDPTPLRVMLHGVGLGGLAYLAALGFDGGLVVVALGIEAAVLAVIARRLDDQVLGWGTLGLLAIGAIHAVAYEVPPIALVTGVADPLGAALAAASVVAATLVCAVQLRSLAPRVEPALQGAAALLGLYAASGLVVTPFESGNGVDSTLLSAHQQGQMVLSAFWSLAGVAAVAVGLRRDSSALRAGALCLLGVAVVKVFLFDLATLESVYRATSFIVLGLLLLLGAFVWQRLRPRAPRDLRETPAALR